MIYFTGDTHGDTLKIIRFAERMRLRKEDTLIILGDAGYNYYGNERDRIAKQRLSHLKPTILCIHGNHEIRPANIPTCKTKEWNGGIGWYEDAEDCGVEVRQSLLGNPIPLVSVVVVACIAEDDDRVFFPQVHPLRKANDL